MNNINKLKSILLIILFFLSTSIVAQIYSPEGLNMPGSWNNWTNPPTNLSFAGNAQTSGGMVKVIPLTFPIYQTIFHVNQNTGSVAGGDYEFKLTSGPLDNIWQNQWGNVVVEMNTLQEYQYGVAGTNEPGNNSVSLSEDSWYIINFNNIGYESTNGIFMELSGEPVDIITVEQFPMLPSNTEEVEITIEVSHQPAFEEHVFLRYSINHFVGSYITEFVFNGTQGSAIIPPYDDGEEIMYYVFSSAIESPQYYDIQTIKYNNNSGSNYSYRVGDTLSCGTDLSLVSTEPAFPLESTDVLITFNAELGNGGLLGYNDDVYAHTGVITSESTSSSDWKYVKTEWGENTPETKLSLIDSNLYQLYIPNIREYYGVPAGEEILDMAFVFRSFEPVNGGSYMEAKTAENSDIFITVYADEMNVKITYPTSRNNLFGPNELVPICATSLQSPTGVGLFMDNEFIGASLEGDNHVVVGLLTSDYEPGVHWLEARAGNETNIVYDSLMIYIRGEVPVAELPEGIIPGINYIDDNTVTLVLQDPPKQKDFAFVIGDFNNWSVNDDSYMNRTPQGDYYWITISGLTPGEEYAYQYYINGDLKLADPYCDKVLDPWNDKWIELENYPYLKDYPFDLTTGIVSVFEPGKQPYNWVVDDFTPVAVHETQSNLIIYELLIRDFVADRRIASVMDSLDYLKNLGINAIELMPINEFEGNDSWGYNPSFYFATDKAYGTTIDYKAFIDACHERDIAVIIDVVLNHSFSQSPLVQMYWDGATNMPTAQNPWYNQTATHPLSPGYDFNHESIYTKEFTKRFFNYWVNEFKVDGFRLDLSKGFTQTYTGQDIGQWSLYDQSRIVILTDYYNSIKENNPDTYVILEHLSDNSEEVVLANTGMLLWANMSEQFNQNTMGYEENSDYSWAYYNDRGFTYPNLIPYMESHDEERLMYKNLMWGNGSGSYDITDTTTALSRISGVIPMYFMVPGPKMIWQFGELGYDYSINYCSDGTVSEDCRTQSKPVRWDYWNDNDRQEVYQVMAGMAALKTGDEAFSLGEFTKDLSGLVKRAWLTHSSMNVCVGSNFDVNSHTITPGFQHTGTWYNYFTGESFDVSNSSGHTVDMSPGDYYVYTDKQITRPFVDLTLEIIYKKSGDPVYEATVALSEMGTRVTGTDGNAMFKPNSYAEYTFTVTKGNYDPVIGTISVLDFDMEFVIEIEGIDGVDEHTDGRINIYPNPANQHITVETDVDYLLQIADIKGKVILTKDIIQGLETINTSALLPGMYILNFSNNNITINKKLIIK